MEEMSSVTRDVRDKLRTVPGVRRIDLHGLRPQRVYMEASVAKLAQLGISLGAVLRAVRSEEHTSELQSLMRISYAVFCLKKKNETIITAKIQQDDKRIQDK